MVLALPASQGPELQKAGLPSVTAENLAKYKVSFPEGMAGKLDLLLITFQREQQSQVDSWMPVAQGLQHSYYDLRYYILPVSGRENILSRWWDNASLRSDQTDPESWPWIVPLYLDKDAFRRSLQIPNEKRAVVLLVDRQGKVLWRGYGAETQANREALMAAVAANLSR